MYNVVVASNYTTRRQENAHIMTHTTCEQKVSKKPTHSQWKTNKNPRRQQQKTNKKPTESQKAHRETNREARRETHRETNRNARKDRSNKIDVQSNPKFTSE